ncbi:uncharacterized protein RJT20DRAFT_131214 [Scheffersomyces xylosifermentans]|uniref:uncharacterized protein n=1 Tax=Scheffersomyces xylosifermentans TaxID=1304137 RepID=UPI00315D57EE
MSVNLRDGLANQPVDRVLEDLLVRFVVNCPEEDLSSLERVFFHVEEAQWFYTDFLRVLNPALPSMKMKSFCSKLLEKCPLIWKWGDPSDALARFGKYKSTIPVRGVALFNKELSKVVLVKGTESNTWSFPRGKISKDESDIDCAVREVEEETGFSAKDLINENDVVERTIKGKNYKIYLVRNVPEDYEFQPMARNEIAKIQWHDIKSLQKKINKTPNQYFIVSTVIKPIIGWINKTRGVVDEEELMLKAEIRLKALLGLNQQEDKNVDAGRELLNILQKVNVNPTQNGQDNIVIPAQIPQQNQNSEQQMQKYIQFALPQHLQNQIPYFAPGPGSQPMYPFYNPHGYYPGGSVPPPIMTPLPLPFQTIASPERQNHQEPQYQLQQPNPQSFQKPSAITKSTSVNSKEFLSILNTKSSKKADDEIKDPSLKASETESNRSKAQNLLSLVGKKNKESSSTPQSLLDIINHKQEPQTEDSLLDILNKKSSKPEVKSQEHTANTSSVSNSAGFLGSTHQASNELEESIRSSGSHGFAANPAPGKKLTLLKRPADAPPSGGKSKDSAELLSLLGKSNKTQESTGANGAPRSTSNELLGLLKKETTATTPTGTNKTSSSNELLSLLKRAPKEDVSVPQTSESVKPPVTSSQELLGLLNKKKLHTIEVDHTSSNELLGLLNKKPVQASPKVDAQSTNGLLNLLHKNVAPTANGKVDSPAQGASIDILGMLNGQKSPQVQPPVQNASNELLGLINKNVAPRAQTQTAFIQPTNQFHDQQPISNPVDTFDNFEDFEDFEDFGASDNQLLGKTSFRNFDIASDEEDVDHLLDEFSDPFVPASADLSEKSFSTPRDFFQEAKQDTEPKKNRIRILKPGDTLNDLFAENKKQTHLTSPPPQPAEHKFSNPHGQSLLALLNGKKTSETSPAPPSDGFQSIYASPSPGVDSNAPISLANALSSQGSPNKNSANILKDLLWKRDV